MSGKRDDLRTQAWRDLRLVILERDNYVCHMCLQHTEGRDATIDHIVPASMTGQPNNTPSNLRTLCRSCNSKKGTKVSQRQAFIKPGWGIGVQ